MKNKLIFAFLGLFLASCSMVETRYSGKGGNDEEKLYHLVIEDFEFENFTMGHGRAVTFEKKYPASNKLCEVLSYKGDAMVKHGYLDVAILEYKIAKRKCDEVKDIERGKVLSEKINKYEIEFAQK